MLPKSAEFVLDMSAVKRNMAMLNGAVLPAKIRGGLAMAGKALMNDAIETGYTTPIKRPGYGVGSNRLPGELRASGAVFVNHTKTANSKLAGEGATGKYQAQAYGGLPIGIGDYQACVVFNAPYAAIQHEAFPNKTEPTAGRFYLSSKLYGNSVKYIGIVARAIKL